MTAKDFIYNLETRPSWVLMNDIKVSKEDECVDIVLFGNYHVKLYYDDETIDVAYTEDSSGYGIRDLEYAAEMMENREEILSLI